MIKLAPSLLAADFGCLNEQIALVEQAQAEWLHLDIMDGAFVPNISYGPALIKALRPHSKLFFDAHLMVDEPARFLGDYQKAGCDLVTVHVEACKHLHRTVQQVKDLGMQVGVALNPATPLCTLDEILPELDLVLLMSVNPGFGGQKYIASVTDKIVNLRAMLDAIESEAELEVDGGISKANAAEVAAAGATVLVAGSAVFSAKNIPLAVREIKNSVKMGR